MVSVRTSSIVALALLGLGSPAQGQVTFQSVAIEPSLIGPRTLFRATLSNMGPACEVALEGELLSASGETVLSFRTERFRLEGGVRTVPASEVPMRSFTYGASDAGRTAQRFQRLPGGDYRFCLRLDAPACEARDQYCDALSVEEMLFLDLVQPWNGDSIDETRPALTWTVSGTGPTVQDAEVRIVLAPMHHGRDPAQALAAERPLFMVPGVRERTMAYPAGMPDLERGRCYAWQAERLRGRRVEDRSEPWGFCVRRRTEPQHNKYVLLDRSPDKAIHEVVDRKIFFRYDEPYASTRVDCSIHGRGRQRMDPLPRNEASGVAGARSVGVNLYELDLAPYGLKPGYYDLVVRDEKGGERRLKFHIAR